MQTFGDLFKHQRETHRLSQAELAKLAGVPVEAIDQIESGHVLPSKIQMEMLAAVSPLATSYEEMSRWKANELQEHWRKVASKTSVDKKWICPNRKWDCPCCLWPYTLQCGIKNNFENTPTQSSQASLANHPEAPESPD